MRFSNSSEFADPLCFHSLLRSPGLLCDSASAASRGLKTKVCSGCNCARYVVFLHEILCSLDILDAFLSKVWFGF